MRNNFPQSDRARPLRLIPILLFALLSALNRLPAQQAGTGSVENVAATGTAKVWGKVDNVEIEGLVQGPSTAATPLQIACVFEYTEDDIFRSPPALPEKINGMVHLDRALNGLITDLRKGGRFTGHSYETLLITPPQGVLPAQKLLLIGLGDRTRFNPDLMIGIGNVACREALRLGVTSFAFGSDLKDAGIDSPTALVSGNVVRGIFQAYRTEEYLETRNMSIHQPLAKVTLLAGPAFFTAAGDGIKDAIAALNK